MTALQELIEILNESQKFINDNDSKEDKYYRRGLREAIEEANKLLEKEEEQIIDAYNHGCIDTLNDEMKQEEEKSGLYEETLEEARDAYNVSQERIYSKEEVLEIIDSLFHRYASSFRIDAKEYFLQFKKK